MNNQKLTVILLRISIASVFLYAALASMLQPYNWIGYMPQILLSILPGSLLLGGFALYEFILAIWLLSGWKSFFAAGFAALTLLAIIAGNLGQLDVLFRDFAIFFASGALMVSAYPIKKIK